MNRMGSMVVAVLIGCTVYLLRAPLSAEASRAEFIAQDGTPTKSTVVYVGDFDLDIWPGKPVTSATAKAPSSGQKPDESSVEQANRLRNSLSASLISALESAGYTAHRLRSGELRPEKGMRIQGVFGVVDEENHLRRAVIGSGLEPAKLQIYAGVSNLERPEQQLYEIAGEKGFNSKYGPIITLSPYVPVAKFEMGKDANEKEFKDLGQKMVAELTILLDANPLSESQ